MSDESRCSDEPKENPIDEIIRNLNLKKSVIIQVLGQEENDQYAIIDYTVLMDTEYFLMGNIRYAIKPFEWKKRKEIEMMDIVTMEVSEDWRFRGIKLEPYPYVQTKFTNGEFVLYGQKIIVNTINYGLESGIFPEPAG